MMELFVLLETLQHKGPLRLVQPIIALANTGGDYKAALPLRIEPRPEDMLHHVIQAVSGTRLPQVLHVNVIPSAFRCSACSHARPWLKHAVIRGCCEQILPVTLKESDMGLSGLEILHFDVQERTPSGRIPTGKSPALLVLDGVFVIRIFAHPPNPSPGRCWARRGCRRRAPRRCRAPCRCRRGRRRCRCRCRGRRCLRGSQRRRWRSRRRWRGSQRSRRRRSQRCRCCRCRRGRRRGNQRCRWQRCRRRRGNRRRCWRGSRRRRRRCCRNHSGCWRYGCPDGRGGRRGLRSRRRVPTIPSAHADHGCTQSNPDDEEGKGHHSLRLVSRYESLDSSRRSSRRGSRGGSAIGAELHHRRDCPMAATASHCRRFKLLISPAAPRAITPPRWNGLTAISAELLVPRLQIGCAFLIIAVDQPHRVGQAALWADHHSRG